MCRCGWSSFSHERRKRTRRRRDSFPRPLAREAFLYPEANEGAMETVRPAGDRGEVAARLGGRAGVRGAQPRPRRGRDDAEQDLRRRDAPVPVRRAAHGARRSTTRSATSLVHLRRRNGLQVLRPMGYDAFGLPAENAAIKEGGHPREITERNIATIREQMRRMGWAIDWSREISTHEPVVLPLDAMALPALLRARARLPQGGAGQVVPEGPDRARQRAGDRRALRAVRHARSRRRT